MGQAAVKRYWPGKAPDWYKEKEEQPESEDEEASGEEEAADVTAIATPVVIKASDDPRLRRLAQVMLALLRATSAAALNAGPSSLTNSHIARQVAKSTCRWILPIPLACHIILSAGAQTARTCTLLGNHMIWSPNLVAFITTMSRQLAPHTASSSGTAQLH